MSDKWIRGSGKLTGFSGVLVQVEDKEGATGSDYTAFTFSPAVLHLSGRDDVAVERQVVNLNAGYAFDQFRDTLADLADPSREKTGDVLDIIVGVWYDIDVVYTPGRNDPTKEYKNYRPKEARIPEAVEPYTDEEVADMIVGKSVTDVAAMRNDPKLPPKYRAVVAVMPKVKSTFGVQVVDGVYAK